MLKKRVVNHCRETHFNGNTSRAGSLQAEFMDRVALSFVCECVQEDLCQYGRGAQRSPQMPESAEGR